jgi:Transposase domain (DUF772)
MRKARSRHSIASSQQDRAMGGFPRWHRGRDGDKPEQRNASRKPYDTILKLNIVVLQSLHNLSDERTEYLIRDCLSFNALSQSGAR